MRTVLVGEMIARQTDHFGENLERLVALVSDQVKDSPSKVSNMDADPGVVAIQKALFQRTGIKVRIYTDKYLAATLPFYSNRNHIFLNEWLRGNIDIPQQTKLLDDAHPKGTVDLMTAKVTGIFSKCECPLFINFWRLVNDFKMNPREITAIILHEVGHLFKACYYADRTDRTNQTLAGVMKELLKKDSGSVDYVYKELSRLTPSIKREEIDQLVNGGKVIAGVRWFKVMVGVVREQTLNGTYNDTSFEAEADSFASRFGFGEELVSSLEKLSEGSTEKNLAPYVFSQLTETLALVAFVGLGLVLLGAGSLFLGMFMSFMGFILLYVSREDVRDMAYDDLKERYLRIRTNLVDQLKDLKITTPEAKALVMQIEQIDLAIKETRKARTIPAVIANFIFSGARETVKSISDQQIYEALASSDFFLEASTLKNLSK